MTNSTGRWGVVRIVVGFTGKMLLLVRANRSASGRRKKALLIGINYNHAPDLQLIFPQRNMIEMYVLLKDKFEFQDKDIITLTDEPVTEVEAITSLPPTQENIVRAVRQFIIRDQDNTDYVFFYSGHAGQYEELNSDNSVEEDGMIEFIMPMDTEKVSMEEYTPNSVIYDTFLHENMIIPLNEAKGCHLFAVFDSRHSATLLDLKHHRCNRVGTLMSAVRRAFQHCTLAPTTPKVLENA